MKIIILILYATTLLNLHISISSNRFLVGSLGFLYIKSRCSQMVIVTYSFPIWMPFISSSCLIALATSNNILNNSGKSRHPFLVPNLRRKAFSFSLLTMIDPTSLFCMWIPSSSSNICWKTILSPTELSSHPYKKISWL